MMLLLTQYRCGASAPSESWSLRVQFAPDATGMWSMHAHKRREHAEQGSQPDRMRLPARKRNRSSRLAVPHICQLQANMGHSANGRSYLDLKRIKTDAPGWRCAAVCCPVCCLPNCRGVGRNLIKNPAARGLQQSPMEAVWNVKIRPPCCGCQAANAISGILR